MTGFRVFVCKKRNAVRAQFFARRNLKNKCTAFLVETPASPLSVGSAFKLSSYSFAVSLSFLWSFSLYSFSLFYLRFYRRPSNGGSL